MRSALGLLGGSGIDTEQGGHVNQQAQDDRGVDVVVVTGLSGAGRGTAAKVLEDLGWYVADNLPPELIPRMIDLGLESTPPIRRLAVVMDVRSRFFTDNLTEVIDDLDTRSVRTRVMFLEASDEVLVRRFGHVRRRHPLQSEGVDGTLSEGIATERDRLAPVKAAADLVIDTTALSIHELRRRIEDAFGGDVPQVMQLTIQSFGFKYGVPIDADMVLDVRFLPNPHWLPELREHTGQEAVVSEFVLSRDGAADYLSTGHHLVELTTSGYRQEGKRYVTIAVGCTGGKHRSVAMAEALADLLSHDKDHSIRVVHRDLGRE
ncbi:RNase adapter RapZ [Antrihabitans cavernicola]|uniref:RNase adapter RapZ n=1 Tax=Antrihabitans cavernicola TaxID=2495913 RepID=A0A5A7SCC3_9NOCA|nr:RNase adapter RapZ [Spelaeibacter cavernicola]